MSLGRLIKSKRSLKAEFDNQKVLCEAIKKKYPQVRLTQASISAIETEKNLPSILTLHVLKRFLEISDEEINQALDKELESKRELLENDQEQPEES